MRGAAAVPARSPGARVAAVAAALLVVLLLVPAVEAQRSYVKGPGFTLFLRPAVPVTEASPPAWTAENPECQAGSVPLFKTSHAWMANVRDNAKIFLELTIPGAFRSGSYKLYGGWMSHTQSVNITVQLEAGIRYLDLPLGFVDNVMHVMHLERMAPDNVVTFAEAMGQVAEFLKENPREVVIVRVRRSTNGLWNDALATAEFDRHAPAGTVRDARCKDAACTLGPSRGRAVFLDDDLHVKGVTFLDYKTIIGMRWEAFPVETSDVLPARWAERRALLEELSTTRIPSKKGTGMAGVLITFSPSELRSGTSTPTSPYIGVSGQRTYWEPSPIFKTGAKESYAESKQCRLDGTAPPDPDSPRVDCTGCGEATTCEIAFEGTSRMLYTWLRRGLTGQPQSYDPKSKSVYPRYLGILVLAFPDNALIDIIVSLNFLPPDRYKEPPYKPQVSGPRPFACRQDYCAASGALSADAYVQTVNRGRIVAGKVKKDDELHAGLLAADAGAEGAPPKTCRVMAVTPGDNTYDRSNTLNGVSGLAVVTSPKGGANGVVVVEQGAAVGGLPPGQVSVATPQSLVTIVTECGAIAGPVSNETGSDNGGPPVFYGEEGVTPFPSLCWRVKPSYASSDAALTTGTEYNRVYAAVMRVVNRTGTFWFDPRAYVEANTCAAFRGDPGVDVVAGEGARLSSERSVNGVVTLTGRLTQCLTDFETAAADSESRDVVVPAPCKSLEVEAAQWIRAHVSWRKHGGVLDEAYPHMGNPESETGNLLFDILPPFGRKPGP